MNDEINLKVLLRKAVTCDKKGRLFEAESLYKEGINYLLELVEEIDDIMQKKTLFDRIAQYKMRCDEINQSLTRQTTRGDRVTTLNILEDSVGNSYLALLEDFLTTEVREVIIEEPNLELPMHYQNLIIFLETLLKACCTLKYLRVITKSTLKKNIQSQQNALEMIKKQIKDQGITMEFRTDEMLNSSRIILSSGFVIKSSNGLHIYKDYPHRYPLGLGDYDFRKCFTTEIDIWRTQIC